MIDNLLPVEQPLRRLFVGIRYALRSQDIPFQSSTGQLVVALAARYQVQIDDFGVAITASAIESLALSLLLMESNSGASSYIVFRDSFLRNAMAIVASEDHYRLK